MSRRKVLLGAAVVMVAALFAIGLALAQDEQPQPPPPGSQPQGQGRGMGGGMDRGQMRQGFTDRIKQALEVTDEEWTALQPAVEKVITLARETSPFGGGMRPMMRRRPEGGGPEARQPEQPQSDVARAAEALQTMLESQDAKPEDIKAKLTALREAREKARQELAMARQALRELLTQRQEARLVLMGILD
ncbi:MAG: hypothetical protein V2A58_18205 [Planctomycetota bacterium]